MTILFTTWYLLDWQYPEWLWIILGIVFTYALYKRMKRLVDIIKNNGVVNSLDKHLGGYQLHLHWRSGLGQMQKVPLYW